MDFFSEKKETRMLNPLKDMAERTVPSEIRMDPLTGRTARICHFMELQWEKPDFDRLVSGTDARCPFCAPNVLRVTPCFPDDIIPQGRLTHEDMVLFPNIAPYDSLGAVATMGADHYIPMCDIGAGRITDAFGLAMTFFNHLDEIRHPESVYHVVNWNYMPPAGSSLIHPHLQVFATTNAPNLMRQELDAARAYKDQNGTNFWDDLVSVEKSRQERYLGQTGRTHWLMAYAPMGVAGDVLAVTEDVRATIDLSTRDIKDIADGLVRVMAAYDQMGIYSFNMNFFTGTREDDHSRFHLLFSPRTFFNQSLGTPDIGALRNLFNETLCMAFPEEISTRLRPSFTGPGNP